jgi:hypothetical protein
MAELVYTRIMHNVDPNRLWFVYVDGKEVGPIKEVEVRHKILTKTLNSSCNAYTEGMADWKALSEISFFNELFEEKSPNLSEKNISDEFDKIPFSAKQQKRSDKAKTFLIFSIILTVAAAVFYFWNPVSEEEITLLSKNNPSEQNPVATEDPFAKKDWAELRNYRNRNDIVGTGFVVARDRIDEEFPILKGAVSTNVNSKDIEYRIYPVPGAHLMALPKVIEGKTSIVNGFFVVGPLSDGGKTLPTGKYRLIAKVDQTYLGEVTLQRGHLPEGPELQKEEEKLKSARFQKITDLKNVYFKKTEKLEVLMKEFQKLKAGAINPVNTNPSTFPADARLALEKLRDLRTEIKNSEGDLLLIGRDGMELLQITDGIWAPLSTAFQEFPNPDPQRFVNFDAKSVELYLTKIKNKISKVPSEEVAQRSETLLNEEMIKKAFMNEEATAR